MKKEKKIFYSLNNNIRYKILKLLSKGGEYSCNISTRIKENQPIVSHQLSRLYHLGIIGVEKRGRRRYYTLKEEKIKKIIEILEGNAKLKNQKGGK